MLKNKVLIVDDCEPMLEIIREHLIGLGVPEKMIFEANGPMQALEFFNSYKDQIELVISDNYMPHSNGLEFCEVIKGHSQKIITILFSGDSNLIGRKFSHIDHILMKPDGLRKLGDILKRNDKTESKKVQITKVSNESIISKAEFVIVKDGDLSLKGLLVNKGVGECSLVLPFVKDFIHMGKVCSLEVTGSKRRDLSGKTTKLEILDDNLAKVSFKLIA